MLSWLSYESVDVICWSAQKLICGEWMSPIFPTTLPRAHTLAALKWINLCGVLSMNTGEWRLKQPEGRGERWDGTKSWRGSHPHYMKSRKECFANNNVLFFFSNPLWRVLTSHLGNSLFEGATGTNMDAFKAGTIALLFKKLTRVFLGFFQFVGQRRHWYHLDCVLCQWHRNIQKGSCT